MALTLYARREPTTDATCRQYCPPAQLADLRDVVLYADPAATRAVARYAPFQTRPDRRHRYVNHNCARFALRWLDN
jgi:hypothetical protein